MAIDIVKEVVGLKNAYGRMRGYDGTGTPLTTWADAIIATSHLEKYINPTLEQCKEFVKSQGISVEEKLFGDGVENFCKWNLKSPMVFVRTDSFNKALKNFQAVTPYGAFGIFNAVTKIASQEIYPKNVEFWKAAIGLAIARSAAGVVPFWSQIAAESIGEAVRELPDTLKSIAAGAFNVVGNLVPDVSGITNLIKWGSIAGGLFILYWYVLKPKKV